VSHRMPDRASPFEKLWGKSFQSVRSKFPENMIAHKQSISKSKRPTLRHAEKVIILANFLWFGDAEPQFSSNSHLAVPGWPSLQLSRQTPRKNASRTADATPEHLASSLPCSMTASLSYPALQFLWPFLRTPPKRNVGKPRKGKKNIISML